MMRIMEVDGEFCVMDDETDTTHGCYQTRGEAMDALQEAVGDATVDGPDFHALLMVEGLETGDGRYFEVGGTTWREPPLPFMVQESNPESGGHAGAYFGGQFTHIYLDHEDATRIRADGKLCAVNADRTRQLIADGLKGVSVDVMSADVDYEVREVDEDGWPTLVLARFANGRLGGATLTPFPAFEEAIVWLADEPEPTRVQSAGGEHLEPADVEVAEVEFLFASAPVMPPLEWFETPEADALTPLTISEDGRVWGHIAPWGECHVGYPAACVTAPTSPSEYRHFHLGEVLTDAGERVWTGRITLSGGHAGQRATAAEALAHYDDTASCVADVRAQDGVWGIWVAGACRPGTTEEQLRTLRASPPSGDWRRIGGALELISVTSVNVPGFPVLRAAAHVEDGVQLALVASLGSPGVVIPESVDADAPDGRRGLLARFERGEATVKDLERRLAELESLRVSLAPVLVAAARARVNTR